MSAPAVRVYQSPELHDGGFAHGAVAAAGATLFTAGISPLDAGGALVAPHDAAAQTRCALGNLDEVLTAGGAAADTVAKLTVYVASTRREDLGAVWQIVDQWWPTTPPTIVIGVTVLPYEGQLVEVEAVAAVRL